MNTLEPAPGEYVVECVFKTKKGIEKRRVASFYLRQGATMDELVNNASSWISMAGLHNFGLETSRIPGWESVQEIVYKVVQVKDSSGGPVRRADAFKFCSRCTVNSSGHIFH